MRCHDIGNFVVFLRGVGGDMGIKRERWQRIGKVHRIPLTKGDGLGQGKFFNGMQLITVIPHSLAMAQGWLKRDLCLWPLKRIVGGCVYTC